MKSYDELNAEMEEIQQMIEAKRNERANAMKEVKRMCKGFLLLRVKMFVGRTRKKN